MSAGPFATWFAKLKARVPRTLGNQEIKFQDDEAEQHVGSRPPAVQVIPGDDVYLGPGQAGRGAAERSVIATARTRIILRVWGNDTDQAHELRRMLVAALHDLGHGSYRLEGGTWNTGGVTKKGTAYEFSVLIDIPIIRDEEATAVITGFVPHVGEIQDQEVEP